MTIVAWALTVKLHSGESECHRTLQMMISTLVQVMAWCHQTTSHYLSQYWPRSKTPYAVTRPQWFKICAICLLPCTWYYNVKWYDLLSPWPHLSIKMPSYQYRKSHCGDEMNQMILRPSYLHNKIFYSTGKMSRWYLKLNQGPENIHKHVLWN